MRSLSPWTTCGFIAHAIIWLLLRGALNPSIHLIISPLIFSLPLSICTNHGKSASLSLKFRLGIQGALSAANLYSRAAKHPNSEIRLLAERYWRWQAWASFCAGIFIFWAILLVHHLFTNTF